MEKYIKYLIKNNYSKNTIITYKNILKTYLNIFHDIRLVKKRMMTYIKQPNTAWTHYNVINSYMNFIGDKRLKTLKELKLPPIPQTYREVMTKTYIYKKTQDFSNPKQVIIRFLFETGIRASELYNIKKINKDTIIVIGKGNKTREIFHNWETTKYFDGFNFTTKTLRVWVKEILGEKYTPHSIRRSHATHMLLSGADPKSVMLQLGHSKIETTYRYLHLSKEKNIKIYNKHF